MTFRVGQKVVCVDVSPTSSGRIVTGLLTLDTIYTIIGFGKPDRRGDIGLHLAEVTIHADGTHTDAFASKRFRPVAERKTDISIFTAMLTPSKVGVDT